MQDLVVYWWACVLLPAREALSLIMRRTWAGSGQLRSIYAALVREWGAEGTAGAYTASDLLYDVPVSCRVQVCPETVSWNRSLFVILVWL